MPARPHQSPIITAASVQWNPWFAADRCQLAVP